MSKIALTPSATGTGVFTISSPATNTDRTLTLPDEAGTVLTSASSIPTSALTGNIIQNAGPAFFAYSDGTTQSVSNVTFYKVLLVNEEFDTAGNFASSRFTPTVAGYYQINGNISFPNIAGGDCLISVFKNGVRFRDGSGSPLTSTLGGFAQVSCILYFNGSTDYVELYAYQTSGSSRNLNVGGDGRNYFNGAMVRAA